MRSYLRRRLWQSLLVLLGVSVVVFLILHLTGDPAALLLPPDATAEDIACGMCTPALPNAMPANVAAHIVCSRASRSDASICCAKAIRSWRPLPAVRKRVRKSEWLQAAWTGSTLRG